MARLATTGRKSWREGFDLLGAVGYDGTHYAASMAMMYIEPTLRR